jgi:hypothetical protein
MAETALSPVARFSPTPGLFVDRIENEVSISGTMELFGPEANSARAESIRHWINSTWSAPFPDGHTITCDIKVVVRPPGVPAGSAGQIEAIRITDPSHVNTNDRSMTLNASETDAFTWTAAHEFGHVLGVDNRYSESIMSQIVGRFGGTRTTTAHPGYASNLMAVGGGALESQNVKDLAAETAPSPYWFNDDEQVRDWINHHALGIFACWRPGTS